MPEVGDVCRGREIGKSGARGSQRYIWHACIDCGKQRWVILVRNIPDSIRCIPCANRKPEHRQKISLALTGDKNYQWKGGRYLRPDGYIVVGLKRDDFFSPMISKWGHVFEHRLIMAKHLNRCLLPWELVHHKNGIKDDNRIENLALVKGNCNHLAFTRLQTENKRLRQRITQLEAQVTLRTPSVEQKA